MMEVVARLKWVRISPTKVRIVAQKIKNKKIGEASAILMYTPKKAATVLKKVLDSAIANAKQKKYIDIDSLFVKNVVVDPGPMLKRYMPRAMGRATKIRKRMSHITIVLDEL